MSAIMTMASGIPLALRSFVLKMLNLKSLAQNTITKLPTRENGMVTTTGIIIAVQVLDLGLTTMNNIAGLVRDLCLTTTNLMK
jgi:hypothetical protein